MGATYECGSFRLKEIEERERLVREVVLGLAPEGSGGPPLRVIMAPEAKRAEAIGSLWALRPGDSMGLLLMRTYR